MFAPHHKALITGSSRALALFVASCGLMAPMLRAGDFSSYRKIEFGANLLAVAKQSGANPADVKTVHARPALIQEMDWRPRSLTPTDPMKEGVFSFFNGDLFRIVVTYDRYKIQGMTADDLVAAISATYGAATRPTAEVAFHSIYGEAAPVVARWQDADYAYDLIRTGDQSSFSMVLYSKRLDALAQSATVEAVRLELQEAPQREIERQQKRDADERLVLEKARLTNKPNFRP